MSNGLVETAVKEGKARGHNGARLDDFVNGFVTNVRIARQERPGRANYRYGHGRRAKSLPRLFKRGAK